MIGVKNCLFIKFKIAEIRKNKICGEFESKVRGFSGGSEVVKRFSLSDFHH